MNKLLEFIFPRSWSIQEIVMHDYEIVLLYEQAEELELHIQIESTNLLYLDAEIAEKEQELKDLEFIYYTRNGRFPHKI